MEHPGRPSPAPDALAWWPEADQFRLDALCDALHFPTLNSFRFADDPVMAVARGDGADGVNLAALIEALWPVLYERVYARTFRPDAPSTQPIDEGSRLPDPEFMGRLSQAYATRSRWDALWVVRRVSADGSVEVQKGDTHRHAGPGQYAFAADPNRPPRLDEYVDLLAITESFIAQPGFYYAYGTTLGCMNDAAMETRIYLHATAEGMPEVLATLAATLNRLEVPFLFKCRDNPAHFDRADVAILVVAWRYLTITLRVLQQVDAVLERFFLESGG